MLDLIIEAYRYFLLFINSLIGDFGWSIIFLSCFVSLLISPLMRFSNKVVVREMEYESILEPRIQMIMQESTGEEQHQRISNLYTRYSYSPFMALRKVTPLFLQLPALFLTFYMLDGFDELAGQSFYWLNDLSKTDNLLFDANLLPFIMTFFNVLATLTTPGYSKKGLVQVGVIALLFLVILYEQSSGLLLFWTMNNAILLIKNVVAWRKDESLKSRHIDLTYISKKLILVASNKYILLVLVYVFAVVSIQLSRWGDLSNFTKTIRAAILVIPVFISLISISYLTKRKELQVGLYVLQLLTLLSMTMTDPLIGLAIYSFISVCYLLSCVYFLNKKDVKSIFKTGDYGLKLSEMNNTLFGLLILTLFILLIDNPFSIFSSAPEEFYGLTIINILHFNLVSFVVVAFASYLLIRVLPLWTKNLLLPCFMFITLFVFMYTKLINIDYGLMQDLKFNRPSTIVQNIFMSAFEMLILITVFWLLRLHAKRFVKYKRRTFAVLVSVSCVTFFINISQLVEDKSTINAYQNPSHLDANDFNLNLSSKKQNVIIFLLDGFSAGILPNLLKENPQIKAQYKDFTWYKNALTSNAGTLGTLPSIYGGHQYTVDNAIKSGNDQVMNVLQSSYPVMPNAFISRGYEASIVGVEFTSLPTKALTYDFQKKLPSENLGDIYQYINNTLLSISVFRSAPLFVKDKIYNNGKWFTDNELMREYPLKIAQFDFLRKLSTKSISVSDKPSFSFIHLKTPHTPWIVTKNGISASGDSGEYKYEAKLALKMLGDVFEKMKLVGVYDNTQILVISDHGWWKENEMFDDSFKSTLGRGYSDRRTPGFVHPLMLVKQPKSNFNVMKESDQFVSNADTPSIACEIINGCAGVMASPLNQKTERTLKFNIIDINGVWSTKGHLKDFQMEEWEVKNNIFDVKNWSRTR